MAIAFVRANVEDYDKWRASYDGIGPALRDSAGVTSAKVYQSATDPNNVTVAHEFPSLEAAQAFAANPELHAAMAAGGVMGAPDVWFVNEK